MSDRIEDLVLGNFTFRCGGFPALQIFAAAKGYYGFSAEAAAELQKWLASAQGQGAKDERGWIKKFAELRKKYGL